MMLKKNIYCYARDSKKYLLFRLLKVSKLKYLDIIHNFFFIAKHYLFFSFMVTRGLVMWVGRFISRFMEEKKFFFYRSSIIGLGYKYFLRRKRKLRTAISYLLSGLSHYVLFKIPKFIKIKYRKKKIFLFSHNKQKLNLFINKVIYFKKHNTYKGKGLLLFKQFKHYIRLKKGKKAYR